MFSTFEILYKLVGLFKYMLDINIAYIMFKNYDK